MILYFLLLMIFSLFKQKNKYSCAFWIIIFFSELSRTESASGHDEKWLIYERRPPQDDPLLIVVIMLLRVQI